MQERVMKHDKIEVLFEHNAVGLVWGERRGRRALGDSVWANRMRQRYDVAIDGFFLAIGHKPNSDIFKPYVDTDEAGYIRHRAGNTAYQSRRAYSPPETLLILTIVKPSQQPATGCHGSH